MSEDFKAVSSQLRTITRQIEENDSSYLERLKDIRTFLPKLLSFELYDDTEKRERRNILLDIGRLYCAFIRRNGQLVRTKKWKNVLSIIEGDKVEVHEEEKYKLDELFFRNRSYLILSEYSGYKHKEYDDMVVLPNSEISLTMLASLGEERIVNLLSSPEKFSGKNSDYYMGGYFIQIFGQFVRFPDENNDLYNIAIELSDIAPTIIPDFYHDDRDDFRNSPYYNDNLDLDQQNDEFWESIG